MSGRLIVIEGLDGSGKATQSALLEESLRALGHKVRKVSFPNYGSAACGPIEMYLGGEFGQNPGDVNAWAASTFYAVDRYAGYKTDWGPFLAEGGVLVADRYTTSNLVHQTPKLAYGEREAYLAWLEDLEYTKLGIPRPSLVLYLDVDYEISRKLLIGRYGDEQSLDIHEKDFDYLRASREAGLWCAERLGWVRVVCDSGGQMRPVDDIAREILHYAKEAI